MNNNISILAEAKKEYTNQLIQILQPRLYEGFKSMYDDTLDALGKEMEERNTQGSSVIKTYQKILKDIPNWNQIMINKEYERILQTSKCDYLDDLIEAVFVTNIKILSSVQINSSASQNLNVNVPSAHHFIHKCYIECAKEIYKNPYVFDNSKLITPKEKHTNLREVLNYADSSINSAIRELLPIRELLKQGLTKRVYQEDVPVIQGEDESDTEDDSTVLSEITESVMDNEDHIDTDKLLVSEQTGGGNPNTIVEQSVPVIVDLSAPIIEERPITENTFAERPVLENTGPENTFAERPVLENTGTENTFSERSVLENTFSERPVLENTFVPPPYLESHKQDSNVIVLDEPQVESLKDDIIPRYEVPVVVPPQQLVVSLEPETKEIIFGGNQTGNNYKQKFNDIKKITSESSVDEVRSVKSTVSSFIEYPKRVPTIYPPHKQKNVSSSQIDKKSSFYKKKYEEYLKNLENSSISTKRTEKTIILDDASEYESDDNLDF
jgi:hypothetical protein